MVDSFGTILPCLRDARPTDEERLFKHGGPPRNLSEQRTPVVGAQQLPRYKISCPGTWDIARALHTQQQRKHNHLLIMMRVRIRVAWGRGSAMHALVLQTSPHPGIAEAVATRSRVSSGRTSTFVSQMNEATLAPKVRPLGSCDALQHPHYRKPLRLLGSESYTPVATRGYDRWDTIAHCVMSCMQSTGTEQ
jgi:hypothetical protein